MSEIKRLSVSEFRRLGYLQELNRCFLHPLGLALEVIVSDDGERFGEVWDYRDDPEGVVFCGGELNVEAGERVLKELADRLRVRQEALGFGVQPLEEGEA